jgi:hypothetical protein
MTTHLTPEQAENRYKQGVHALAEKWGGYTNRYLKNLGLSILCRNTAVLLHGRY